MHIMTYEQNYGVQYCLGTDVGNKRSSQTAIILCFAIVATSGFQSEIYFIFEMIQLALTEKKGSMETVIIMQHI